MTNYSRLESLITDYDVLANVERGYDGAKVEAAYQAINAECDNLGVSVAEGCRLAASLPATRKVEVAGPAHVLTDGNEVRQFDTAEEARAANHNGQALSYFVPAGESRSFAVAA